MLPMASACSVSMWEGGRHSGGLEDPDITFLQQTLKPREVMSSLPGWLLVASFLLVCSLFPSIYDYWFHLRNSVIFLFFIG